MKLFDASLIIIGAVVAACAIAGIVSQFFLGKDNAVEQEMEKVIKDETGVEIDLSP